MSVTLNLGQTEGEVTEHSMRKIMDTLVTDFPVSSSMTQEENRKGQANQAADDDKSDE